MIPGLKKLKNVIIQQLLKQFKLDEILDYVKKPNDLDRQMEVVQKTLSKYGKIIEEVEKNMAILLGDSHPPLFGEEDKKVILSRLKNLEGKKK